MNPPENDIVEPFNFQPMNWVDLAPYFPNEFHPLDIVVNSASPTLTAAATFTDGHANSIGMVHGGVLATVLDVFMALIAAVETRQPQVTRSLNVRYLRPCRVLEPVSFMGQVTRSRQDRRDVRVSAQQRGLCAIGEGELISVAWRQRRSVR